MDKEMLGIIYALICLVLTAFNDFIFKMFARKERSKGLFCTIIGIFWMAALSWTLRNCGNIDWKSTIFWGCVSGVMSAGGNLLLIEGMSRQSAGLCSLIYRLNLVPTVIAAGIFLGEIPSMTQYIGIVLALFAIILFQWGNSAGNSDSSKWAVQAIVMVGIAAFMRAAMNLSYKYGFLHGANKDVVPFINSLFWIFGGLLYALIRERKIVKFDRKLVGYGVMSWGAGRGDRLFHGGLALLRQGLGGGSAGADEFHRHFCAGRAVPERKIFEKTSRRPALRYRRGDPAFTEVLGAVPESV